MDPAADEALVAEPDVTMRRTIAPLAEELDEAEPEATTVAEMAAEVDETEDAEADTSIRSMTEPAPVELDDADPDIGCNPIAPLADEVLDPDPATPVVTPSGLNVMTPMSYAAAGLIVPENVWVAVVAPGSLYAQVITGPVE